MTAQRGHFERVEVDVDWPPPVEIANEAHALVDAHDPVICPEDGDRTPCPTPDCPGDPRYAAPGRRHLPECRYPLPAPHEKEQT